MKIYCNIIMVLFFLFVTHTTFAQTEPEAAIPNISGPTLAAALATASLPTHRIFIAVAAETVPLPLESITPPNGSTLTTVADTYQRSVRAFGAVTAIAPQTMFVLNPHPDNPDLYAGLQPEQAFKMLAGSLSDSQWQGLTSQNGLGLSDLTSNNQREMFQALFPGGSLQVRFTQTMADAPDGVLSRDPSQVHLRLTLSVRISLPVKGNSNNYVSSSTGNAYLSSWWPDLVSSPSLFEVPQSALFSNRLKPGQLNWNLPELRTLIPLYGVRTVGDLVTRISQRTHLELYADKRYESRSLTILGNDTLSAPASDLLRAMAYCVSGAFRQIGPAYVLTDDVIGVEARRQVLHQFEKESFLHLEQLRNAAADTFGTKHSFGELKALGNPLALNDVEEKNLIRYTSDASVKLPLNQMTPGQQENVRQQVTDFAQNLSHKPEDVPDMNGQIDLSIQPQLEMLVSSPDSSMTNSVMNLEVDDLFAVSEKLGAELYQKSVHPIHEEPKKTPTPLSQTMALVQHRAVLIHPTSATELVSDIGVMKRLGFNELWLDVFSQGHVQTALPDGSDLLTLALRKTRGTSIHVYAVMDLLQWGADAPLDAVDLDNLGENSAQEQTRLRQEEAAEISVRGTGTLSTDPILGLSVTPLNSQVSVQLISEIRNLALRPGLAGIVWRKTSLSGYDHDNPYDQYGDSDGETKRLDLGYTVGSRLAFLRWQHIDPIDISTPAISYGDMDVDPVPITPIPTFNNEQQDVQLSQAWDKFRRDADVNFMRTLYAVAKESNPHISLFVQQRLSFYLQDWYGSWTSQTAPLPGWHTSGKDEDAVWGGVRFAKSQSAIALINVDTEFVKSIADLPSSLEIFIHGPRQDDFHRYAGATLWDGFVWDTTEIKPNPLH